MSGPKQQVNKDQSDHKQAVETSDPAVNFSLNQIETPGQQRNIREAFANASRHITLLDTPIPNNSDTPEGRFSNLSQEKKREVLSALTGDAALDLQNRARVYALSERFGDLEASLILSSNLSQDQIEQILQLPTERELRISSFLKISPSEAFNKLHSIQEKGDLALSEIKDNALAELVALLSSEDVAKLEPSFSEKIFARLSRSPALMLTIQQSRYQESHIATEKNLIFGAHREAASIREDLSNTNLPSSLSSHTKGLELTHKGLIERAESVSGTLEKNSEPLSRSRAMAHVATLLSSLPPSQDLTDNIKLANRAAQLYSQSSNELFSASPTQPDLKAGLEHIRAGGESFQKSAKNLDIAVNTMRVVRDGSVIVVAGGVSMLASPLVFGAVVTATGSTALGATVTVVGGAGVGSLVGGVYGGVNSSVENSLHVLVGNKSAEDAQADTLKQLQKDAESGLIVGVGSGVSTLATKSLSSVVGPLSHFIKGAASGGAAAGASSVSRELLELTAAIKTFNSKHPDATTLSNLLSPELAQHLKDSGFSFERFKSRFGSDVAFGILLGGLGAQLQSIREAKTAAGAGISSQLTIDLADISSASAVGFARTYFSLPEDRRTFEELLPQSVGEAFSNFNSTIQGRAAVGSKGAPSFRERELAKGAEDTRRPSHLPDLYNGEGVELHKSGKIAYVSDRKVLKTLFARVSGDERFAESVAAFYDAERKVAVAMRANGTDRTSRIIKASFIKHELTHRAGGTEERAYRAQAEYLRKNGMELSFVSGSPVITTGKHASDPKAFESSLKDFLGERYLGSPANVAAVISTPAEQFFNSSWEAYVKSSAKVAPDSSLTREAIAEKILDLSGSLGVEESASKALANLKGEKLFAAQKGIEKQQQRAEKSQLALANLMNLNLEDETMRAIISKTSEMSSNRNLQSDFLEFMSNTWKQIHSDLNIADSDREKVLVAIIEKTNPSEQVKWEEIAATVRKAARSQKTPPSGESLDIKLTRELIERAESHWESSNVPQDQAKSIRVWLNTLVKNKLALEHILNLLPEGQDNLIRTITDIAIDPRHNGKLDRFINDGWLKRDIRTLIADPQSLKQQIMHADTTWSKIDPFIPEHIRNLMAESEEVPYYPPSDLPRDGDGFITTSGYRHKIKRYENAQISNGEKGVPTVATIQIRWHTKTPNPEVEAEHPSIVVQLLDENNQETHRLVYSSDKDGYYWIPTDEYSKMRDISFQNHNGRESLKAVAESERSRVLDEAHTIMKNSHIETPLGGP